MPQQSLKAINLELSQEQIQNLLTTSTGFIETYIIPVHDDADIILPQNMILSALNVPAHVTEVEWHEKLLPTYNVHNPVLSHVIALIVEGEEEQTRFALLCDEMPKTMRLRISKVLDYECTTSDFVYQYVKIDEVQYQIPHLHNIQQKLFMNL